MSENIIPQKAGDYSEDHRQFFVNAVEQWDMEIIRRLAEVDTGIAEYIEQDEFQRRIRLRVGNR